MYRIDCLHEEYFFLVGLSVSSEKLKDVFSIVVPVIDSPQFLTWLMQQVCKQIIIL